MEAEQLIDEMLNDPMNCDYELYQFMPESLQAEMFREIIGVIACYEYDPKLSTLENQAERLAQIEEYIEKALHLPATLMLNRKAA